MLEMEEALFLSVAHAFKGERSIYGVFHLLQGKKSAQTIQDGHFFSILPYFATLPELKRTNVARIKENLEKNDLLTCYEEDRVKVTERGKTVLKEFHDMHPYLQDLHGWAYHQHAQTFWLRFTLFVQALTNLQYDSSRFFPITQKKDIQQWVKKFIPTRKEEIGFRLMNLHIECLKFLEQCGDLQASLFVMQLSGVERMGQTIEQAAHSLKLSVGEAKIMHMACLHRLLHNVEQEKEESFKELSLFISDINPSIYITESTRETAQLINRGWSIEQVAKKRRLKQATIEDHLVELALVNKDFNIDMYVDPTIQQDILNAVGKLKTKRLREIKQVLSSNISYFMIRLTLTKRGVINDS